MGGIQPCLFADLVVKKKKKKVSLLEKAQN